MINIKNNHHGFTLIELLAIIVILAVIMAIAIPPVVNVVKSSKDRGWKDNVKLISKALDYSSNIFDTDLDEDLYILEDLCSDTSLVKKVSKFDDTDISCSNNVFYLEGTGNFIDKFATIDCTSGDCYTKFIKKNDIDKLCIVNDKKYETNKEYYNFYKGITVEQWSNSPYNTSNLTIEGFVNSSNNYYEISDLSEEIHDSNEGCYYPKMVNVCVLSGYPRIISQYDFSNIIPLDKISNYILFPEGMKISDYNKSNFKEINIKYDQFLLKNGLFTTSSADSDSIYSSEKGCYLNIEKYNQGAAVKVDVNHGAANGQIITCYSNQTIGECLKDSNIGGLETYHGIKDNYGYTTPVSAMYLINSNSYLRFYDTERHVCLDGESIVEVYDEKRKKKLRKKLKNVTYDDLILCWDFDLGIFSYQKPVWIMKKRKVNASFVLKFSDGSILKVAGDHRIFNYDKQIFTHCKSDVETPIGMKTINSNNEVITLISKESVKENISICNVVTYKNINIYANGILTSRGSNNLYKINNMQFVKDKRKTLSREELSNISDDMFYGFRLGERNIELYGSRDNAIKVLTDFVKELECMQEKNR